ncbi:hypothetical protein J6590_070167 [Homalodisca vitripennis]|nr:hypothetical protein J6590_070167 [Homalodisca vitripennis]
MALTTERIVGKLRVTASRVLYTIKNIVYNISEFRFTPKKRFEMPLFEVHAISASR